MAECEEKVASFVIRRKGNCYEIENNIEKQRRQQSSLSTSFQSGISQKWKDYNFNNKEEKTLCLADEDDGKSNQFGYSTGSQCSQHSDYSFNTEDERDAFSADNGERDVGIENTEQLENNFNNEEEVDLFSAGNEERNVGTENTEQQEQNLKSRKRQRNEENWKRNVKKRLRNSGKEYRNYKNILVPAKAMKPPCNEKCRLKCTSKINEVMRKSIFAQFWNLGDITRQRDFIKKFVRVNKKKRERLRRPSDEEEECRRKLSFFYFMPTTSDEDSDIKICKTFFLNTLSISHQMVKTVVNKTFWRDEVTVEGDKRGKTEPKSRLPTAMKKSVIDHINSFQPVESHYCRAKSSKQYLPSSLNVTKMHEMYKTYCSDNNIFRPAKLSMYRHIFLTQFNLGFHVPKKDQCELCNKFRNSTVSQKEKLEEKYEKHLKAKELSRKKKEMDKKEAQQSSNFCVCAYDLQKVLICPKDEISQLYYKRKLATYNLTVYDIGQRQGYCYMWHEGIAGRGACEIGSCILSFIKTKVQEGTKKFSFYSDNCSGQNRNRYIYCLYMMCAAKYQIDIRHQFLESGHTQNEGDSMHSVIERAAKHIPVYCPSQWYNIARTACKKKPYVVNEMYREDFFNLKNLLENCTKNWKRDQTGGEVNWTKVKVIEIYSDNPLNINFKYDYDGEVLSIDTVERKRGTFSEIRNYELEFLRSMNKPIPSKKYNDLLKLCQDRTIPEIYHPFYKSLTRATTTRCDNSDCD